MELFVSDLDGTLLNSKAQLSDYSRKTINRLIDKGLNFTIATARAVNSASKILSGVNFKLPVILMNGVLIYNTVTAEYERAYTIKKELVKLICEEKNKCSVNGFMYTINGNELTANYDSISTPQMKRSYDEGVKIYNKKYKQLPELYKTDDDVIYFAFTNTKEKLEPLYNKLKDTDGLELTFYFDIYTENLWYLEIFSSDASKKNAVLYICNKYKFDKITCFGDNTNDLPMFEISNCKYAVENANEIVKEKCDSIIESNDDDGVAKLLIKMEGNLNG